MRLKDIAVITGFSPSTVSRVLKDDPRISGETKKKVLSTVRKAGYRVNNIARSLKTNTTETIGFMAPELANEFFMKVAEGAEAELGRQNYSMLICSSRESEGEEKRQLALLLEKRVDGVIIIPSSGRGGHFSLLNDFNVPVVLADRKTEDFPADIVLSDNEEGAYKAVNALIERGHRRIGFIGGNIELNNAKERFSGYKKALSKRGLPIEEEIIRFGDFHSKSGYRLMSELLNLPLSPDHVFAANHFMHIGAAKYLASLSREGRSPLIKLSSFDEMDVSSIFGFLTLTVAQPMEEIGRRAASLLLERIREKKETPGKRKKPREVRLPTELIYHNGPDKR
jgi:LacI family transcriptional regulator